MVQPTVLVAGPGDATVPPGFVDGVYTDARFNCPVGMDMAADGFTAYICDYGNNAIRALDTRTREVTTYVSGAPLISPMHLTIARSGNIYVSCAENGDRFAPVVKITPGRTMTIVGQAHQPRGIAVDVGETVIHLMEQGHTFFGEIWRSAHADMTMGGVVTDRDEMGTWNFVEGACLAPDGYLYGVSTGHYFYSAGAGFKRFTPGGGNTWNESGAPPGQTGYGPFSDPQGGDGGRPRRAMAVRLGSDGRLWFYNTAPGAGVFLTKIDVGITGGIHSDELLGSFGTPWGIALNRQDTVYFSACGLEPVFGTAQGGSSVTFYYGVGTGLHSIYLVGCPPNETATSSDHRSRLVIDDEVVTVRGKVKGAPKLPISADRDRCGRPLPAEMTKPQTRLRVRGA